MKTKGTAPHHIFVTATALAALLLSAGCASTQLKPEAANVVVSELPPPQECKEIGQVDSYTNVNVANTSKNVLVNIVKNRAYELGGNYVKLEEHTTLKHAGPVFKCPPAAAAPPR